MTLLEEHLFLAGLAFGGTKNVLFASIWYVPASYQAEWADIYTSFSFPFATLS